MNTILQRLQQRRKTVWHEAASLLDEIESRGEKSGERERWNELQSELDQIDERIGDLRAKDAREDDNRRAIRELGGDVPIPAEGGRAESRAFNAYVRDGDEAELRAQGVAAGAAGGYTVPEGFRAKVTERLQLLGGVRSVAEIIRTDEGNDLPWPTNDDTDATGAILDENTQVTEDDVAFGQKTLGAYLYTSKMTRVSIQLLQDTGIDLEAFLARKHAERIARAQNPHFTTGTGTNQPQGLVTGATSGVTAAATAAITTDELLDLVHSVDPAYREDTGNVGWMMADTTFATIRKLKDNDNRYLVEPDVQRGIPNTLFGYRVTINNDMPAPAASTVPVLFGNFRAGYIIRDVKSFAMVRFTERYGDFFQVGFTGFWRSDGLVQDAHAYRGLTMAAV